MSKCYWRKEFEQADNQKMTNFEGHPAQIYDIAIKPAVIGGFYLRYSSANSAKLASQWPPL